MAQRYCSIADELENDNNATCAAHYEKNVEKAKEYMSWMEHPGFMNKMFVRADLMLHRIRITNVRIQQLQDILDEDCLKEGIFQDEGDDKFPPEVFYNYDGNEDDGFDSPREAFAHLINKVSRKDVWSQNPYVFVYDFELIK